MSTVLLVDDDDLVVRALARGLRLDGHDVVRAHSAQEGLDRLATSEPDVVVLDLGLPDHDGVEVVRRMREHSDVPVLMLSGEGTEQRKVEALDAGADDFCQKPVGINELCARLRALLRRGRTRGTTGRVSVDGLDIDFVDLVVRRDGDEVRLTPLEWRLLQTMARQPGRLLTHGALLKAVWGPTHGDESRQTLRTHVRALRAKLGDPVVEPRLIRTETGAGYRWLPASVDRSDPAAL